VPLAALLSHATESVAAKTGDAAGGLLNATWEPDRTGHRHRRLRAGQYMLVKASIAGAIVANTLFMLGASFCWAVSSTACRSSIGPAPASRRLLFLATVAMLVPRPSPAPTRQTCRRLPGR